MSKIVLIDGHSILHRAFYGVPDLSNAEGLHTNAVYGFLNIMFKILDEEKPEYLTVAFDVHAPTFRHEIYKEYKGTRKPMPEELREQVPVMKEVLKAMGIKTVEKPGLEADDIPGPLAGGIRSLHRPTQHFGGIPQLRPALYQALPGGQAGEPDHLHRCAEALYQVEERRAGA